MTTETASAPTRGSTRRRTWHAAVLAVLITSAFCVAGLALSPSGAQAAVLTVDQCNGQGPGPLGATTGMTCTVTVVNTINGGVTSSTTTMTRQCSLDPCAPGNGTFTTSSVDLVTSVNQCNGSDNDAAHPITCDVTITNNISRDTPGARPLTAATVNQCVGSGGGGGSNMVNCIPATTTNATVTQCNGSGNGGGATVDCAVGTASRVSPAIPIRVNQCNGTGNPGGSVVTCRTNINTVLTAASGTATATPSASPTATGGGNNSTATPQVTNVPTGGVPAGGGSDSGLQHVWLFALGGCLLLAAASILLRHRLVEGAGRFRR